MSEYMFGTGPGWLPDEADEIAQKHGARLCNYTGASCKCGRGCPPHTCEKARRHWFAGPNRGRPFDQDMAEAVLNEVYAAEQAGDFDESD